MSDKNRKNGKTTEHVIPAKDKRAERKIQNLLRKPLDSEDDWDDYDLAPREHRFKKSQRLD